MSLDAFIFPEEAVLDDRLLPSGKRLLLVLCANFDPSSEFLITLRTLAELSGLSESAVHSGLDCLLNSGHIIPVYQRRVEYRYCRFAPLSPIQINRHVYNRLKAANLTNGDITVFLYFCRCHSLNWMEPSLWEISLTMEIARSSLCRSLRRLNQAGIFTVEHRSKNKVSQPNRYSFS